jgi:hypothetical protein
VWTAVLPLLYCLFSAIIGTQSVLFSKTLAVLLRATASGDNQVRCGCAQGSDAYPLAIHCVTQQWAATWRVVHAHSIAALAGAGVAVSD